MKNSELLSLVTESLSEVRTFVQQDGGDLEVVEVTKDLVARIELKGACTSCNLNNMTFRAGVEEAIKRAVPQIKKVEAINFELQGS